MKNAGMRDTGFKSRKFIAVMIFSAAWFGLILTLLYVWHGQELSLLRCIVLVIIIIGWQFIQIGYIGGQAWLDRYVKVAAMQTGMIKPSGPVAPEPEVIINEEDGGAL